MLYQFCSSIIHIPGVVGNITQQKKPAVVDLLVYRATPGIWTAAVHNGEASRCYYKHTFEFIFLSYQFYLSGKTATKINL